MLKKWLLHLFSTLFLLAMLMLSACQSIQLVQAPAQQASPAYLPWNQLTIEQKISNAMSGGPAAISRYAKIVEWPSEIGGEMTVLREGTNGWTCMTDDAGFPYATLLNDPLCFDEPSGAWFEALFTGTELKMTSPGIVYSIVGSISFDNDDPYASGPPEGKGLDMIPPHMGILTPSGLNLDDFSNEMHMGLPFVMYGKTPYEHLMISLVTESLEPVDPADRIGNAMSAAHPEVGMDATILDWPTEPGGEWTVLREGTNGWTCIPDDSILEIATPTNDPMCLDATFLEWMKAFMAGTEPNITKLGIGFMFQGGSNVDNDDPSIMVPPEGGAWHIELPHVMAVFPEPLDASMSNDPHYGGPYVMFAGTPYEHLMIPVDPVAVGSAAAQAHVTSD